MTRSQTRLHDDRRLDGAKGGKGPARVVRVIAGAAAGFVGGLRARRRRGSFLVLVVGTLALMSVFAVVYISIGRADLGTSSGVKRNAERDDVPDQIAGYISNLVGNSLFSVRADGLDAAGNPIYRRTLTDYPRMSWDVTSIDNKPTSGGDQLLNFNPKGSIWLDDPADRARVASALSKATQTTTKNDFATSDKFDQGTPWLAATAPTYLDFDNVGPTDSSRLYLDYKDWAQISNIAPDGAFVNLANLRNNFAAQPAKMRQWPTTDGGTKSQWLLDKNGVPIERRDFENAGAISTTNVNGSLVVVHPADLTMRQRGAFRLAKDFSFVPGNARYALNQWADADGDGFLDSRWCELVDARNPFKPKSSLESKGKYRYFVAARIIDLSALVNVATSTDLVAAPTDEVPVGARPSDVDLRRVLMMVDSYDSFNQNGYNGIPQPPSQRSTTSYSGDDAATARDVGALAYQAMYSTGAKTTGLDKGAIPGGKIPPTPIGVTNAAGSFYFGNINFAGFGRVKTNDAASTDTVSSVGDRGAIFDALLSNTASVASLGTNFSTKNDDYLVGSILNTTDMLDLLAYRGINAPDITSNLERIFGGRYVTNNPLFATNRYDPLRSNRPLDIERGRFDLVTQFGVADPAAMLWSAVDVRQQITAVSGSRGLRATPVALGPTDAAKSASAADTLSVEQLKYPVYVKGSNGKSTVDANQLFRGYTAALVPDANRAAYTDQAVQATAKDFAWPPKTGTNKNYDKSKFLNYGYNSPELGLVMSAHMAANMGAAIDKDGDHNLPFPYTVMLDERARANPPFDLEQDKNNLVVSSRTNKWSWWPDKFRLDARDESRATLSPLGNVDRTITGQGKAIDRDKVYQPAMNVYGIVPEPVLTAAAVLHVYSDFGDEGGVGNEVANITIDGTINAANLSKDLVAQVLAFQLSNPFDVDITLGEIEASKNPISGKATTQSTAGSFYYYIEYGGRYFKLPNGATDVIKKNSSRTFYAACTSVSDIQSKFGRFTATGATFKTWLDAQVKAGPDAPMEMTRIDATGNADSTFADLLTLGSGPHANLGVVRLWRGLQARDGQKNEKTNALENDQLIDRLRYSGSYGTDVGKAFLKSQLPTGDNLIGTDVIPTDHTSLKDSLSVATGMIVRRPKDPSLKAGDAALVWGAPAFMIERKNTDTTRLPLNLGFQVPDDATNLQDGDFAGSDYGNYTLTGLLAKTSSIFGSSNDWLTKPPSDWNGGNIVQSDLNADFESLRTELFCRSIPLKPGVVPLKPENVRLADLLLPLAIGPEYNPDPAITDFDEKYTTLGEALAFALGYDNPKNTTLYTAKFGGNPDPVGGGSGLNADAIVDRGHLRLDAFVPFFDNSDNGTFDAKVEHARGNGVPIALNVLDTFTVYQPQIDRATPGLINANTALLSSLRAQPLLSPPNTAAIPIAWWWTTGTAQHGSNSDIAASVLAFRDKIQWQTRSGLQVAFWDTSNFKPTQFNQLDGRRNSNGFTGVRETPGLASIGELLTVRGATQTDPNNMDYLYYTAGVKPPAGVRTGTAELQFDGAYSNKLVLANAMVNTASVRSDYFAVWFLVAGYSKSDVVRPDGTPLLDTDPMVPSIQRRFVMVLDRSAVTQKGQKPRVVLFKELPL